MTNETGTYEFPSNGTIPSDWDMFQPRLGVAYDVHGDNKTLLRGSAGIYYARIPGLNVASTRSTNGSRGQSIFRSSALTPVLGPPPTYGELLPTPQGDPFRPSIFVFDQNFENPRTISTNVGIERELHASGLVGSFGVHLCPRRQADALCQPATTPSSALRGRRDWGPMAAMASAI